MRRLILISQLLLCIALLAGSLLLVQQPANAETASRANCTLTLDTPPVAGLTALTVTDAAGSTVDIIDQDSAELLGQITLGSPGDCATATIPLNQPLYWNQRLAIMSSTDAELFVYVAPEEEPVIQVLPPCGEVGVSPLLMFGAGWGPFEPVSIDFNNQPITTVVPSSPVFIAPITVTVATTGTYVVAANSGDVTAQTLYQVPCSDTIDTVIGGTVYKHEQGNWQPTDNAIVTLFADGFGQVEQHLSFAGGHFEFYPPFELTYRALACVEQEGIAYAAQADGLMRPNPNVDLFLAVDTAGACADILIAPPPGLDLADLTISLDAIRELGPTEFVADVLVSNASLVDITQGFYVDISALAENAPYNNGLSDVLGNVFIPSLASESELALSIPFSLPHLGSNDLTFYANVDAGNFIPEINEFNNLSQLNYRVANAPHTLAIFVLAFDNPSYSAGNLAPQYSETMEGIIAASNNDPGKLAIVLADLEKDGDTTITLVQNGQLSYISGLPDSTGTLDGAITEYDMGDGETLGGFLRWARSNYPADNNSLMIYGHGAPIMPETDLANLFPQAAQSRSGKDGPIPLPSWVIAHPDFTDVHPLSVLTPYDLRVALSAGTEAGQFKFDLVDLVHCFSLSIEEAHEVAPYTETISGSPNYSYYDAILPGEALDALQANMTPADMADAVLNSYDSNLPAEGYPRILTAIDSDSVLAVKATWDTLSGVLVNAHAADPADTRSKVLNAYAASSKYDSTFCEPDWALSSPDALADMHDFSAALATEFGTQSGVGALADLVTGFLDSGVTARYVRDGQPYFAGQGAPVWAFGGKGIALYADFAGVARNGSTELSYISDFYTHTVSAENPYPYSFITPDGSSTTWADVFTLFWSDTNTSRAACLTTFPPGQDTGEVGLAELVSPALGEATLSQAVLPSVVVSSGGDLRNVIINFEIEQAGSVVYTDTIGTRGLFAGQHWISAEKSWTPTAMLPYTLTITLDPGNYVIEPDESNNVLVFTDDVAPAGGASVLQPDAGTDNGQQWITSPTAPIEIAGGNGRSNLFDSLTVTLFEYGSPDSGVASALPIATENVAASGSTVSVPLDGNIEPGPLQLHVWTNDGGTRSRLPDPIRINYAPANAPISADTLVCYPFLATIGDHIVMHINVPNGDDANLFVWYPYNDAAPNLVGTRVGDDTLVIESAPLTGDYLLCVRGETEGGTTYTLSVSENAGGVAYPTSGENAAGATVPSSRIALENPPPIDLSTPLAVQLQPAATAQPSTIVLVIAALATLLVTLAIRPAKGRANR